VEAYEGDEEIKVPRVVAGTERILVTEWMEGVPLSQIIATGTDEQRDRASLLLARFLFSGPVLAGLLHADPHPGNFRLLPDGRLGVIDFGAVNRLPDGAPSRSAGSPGWRSPATPSRWCASCGPRASSSTRCSSTPTRCSTTCSAARADRGRALPLQPRVAARAGDPRRRPALAGRALGRQLNLPPSYLLIHRVTLGTIGVLCQLGGEAAYRRDGALAAGLRRAGQRGGARGRRRGAVARTDRPARADPRGTAIVQPPRTTRCSAGADDVHVAVRARCRRGRRWCPTSSCSRALQLSRPPPRRGAARGERRSEPAARRPRCPGGVASPERGGTERAPLDLVVVRREHRTRTTSPTRARAVRLTGAVTAHSSASW
jgi:hypothetical protein